MVEPKNGRLLAFGECRLIPASEVKSLQIKGGTPSVGAQGWYRQNVSFFLLRQGKHEVMCTVSLNRPTCSEGTRLVLRLMNIIFGHEKRSKCVPPRPLPSPQRSRGHARAAPSMSLLSSAILAGRPPCGKSFLHSCPATVPGGFTAFLHRLHRAARDPVSQEKRGEGW